MVHAEIVTERKAYVPSVTVEAETSMADMHARNAKVENGKRERVTKAPAAAPATTNGEKADTGMDMDMDTDITESS